MYALEVDLRTPILGLENVFNEGYAGWDGTSSTGDTLRSWRRAAADAGLEKRLHVLNDDKVTTARPDLRISAGHGSFDNDVDVVGRSLAAILGGQLLAPLDDLRGF